MSQGQLEVSTKSGKEKETQGKVSETVHSKKRNRGHHDLVNPKKTSPGFLKYQSHCHQNRRKSSEKFKKVRPLVKEWSSVKEWVGWKEKWPNAK